MENDRTAAEFAQSCSTNESWERCLHHALEPLSAPDWGQSLEPKHKLIRLSPPSASDLHN